MVHKYHTRMIYDLVPRLILRISICEASTAVTSTVTKRRRQQPQYSNISGAIHSISDLRQTVLQHHRAGASRGRPINRRRSFSVLPAAWRGVSRAPRP